MSEREHSPFLPILIALLSLSVWFGYQTFQLIRERSSLSALSVTQQTVLGNSQKMRGQLEALAAGTSRLAQQGNPNAQKIVSALAQRGITIRDGAKPAGK